MQPLKIITLSIVLIICSCQPSKVKHTPSPKWEDQIIYFMMTDRFYDGDASNNDQGENEYDPNDDTKFQGGDLVGIQQNLDYLEELGVTGIWTTPTVLNQWWNPEKNFTGYHGYWASDFKQMDPHFGTLDELKALTRALHRRGMYYVQDIVVNHVGDYIRYEGGYNPDSVAQFYKNYGQPVQAPFDLNDPNNPEHLKADIYHFTPEINNYGDQNQVLNYQLSNLDDLNTSNPLVRKTLGESFRYWVEEADVDAFRFDTPLYVEHDFFNHFLHNMDTADLGIYPFAQQLGKDNFYTFGETWVQTQPFDNKGEKRAAAYLGTRNKPEMDAVLNFPLQQELDRVLTGGYSTDNLSYRLNVMQELFPHPTGLVNFIDNHDMARFRTKGSEAAYQQAMLMVMSVPGVPVIYQGTEQGMFETRKNMFDHLNTETETFKFIQKLCHYRTSQPATRRGKIEIIADSKVCEGLFLFKLKTDEENLYVALNVLDEPILASNINLKTQGTIQSLTEVLTLKQGWLAKTNEGGLDYLQLAARQGLVFKIEETETLPTIAAQDNYKQDDEIQVIENTIFPFQQPIKTTQPDSVFALMNGNLSTKVKGELLPTGAAKANLLTANLQNGQHSAQMIAYKNGEIDYISPKEYFYLGLQELQKLRVTDAIGDDKGPEGNYQYPTDASFKRQADIKAVAVKTAGNNFTLDIQMAQPISTIWKPVYGFDHVNFHFWIDKPDKKGITSLSGLNAQMPNDLDWDYCAVAGGWSISMFSSNGASAKTYGKITGSTPQARVDLKSNTISFTFPATTIGKPQSLEGINIYITTWDGGGAGDLRPLKPKPEGYSFGGGTENDAKIMDDILIRLK